jgi:hypothetical protein
MSIERKLLKKKKEPKKLLVKKMFDYTPKVIPSTRNIGELPEGHLIILYINHPNLNE